MPVCDEAGRVVGVLSRSDVLTVFLRDDASIRAEIVDDVVGRILLTDPAAVRGTFRNWDHPVRRQIFAGFRLAWDV